MVGRDTNSNQDEMVEVENEAVRERVSDLERKVQEQGDEIVCLRSTLADVLRRLSQIEGSKPASTTPLKSPLRVNGSGGKESGTLRYRTDSKDNLRRVHSYANSSLPQRRGVHYQSTGSLQSESPSSSSVSPPPSSGSPTPRHVASAPQGRDTLSNLPSPSASPSPSNLHTAKRWSSTGDFNNTNSQLYNSRLAAKSLFNLNTRPQHTPLLKHGTREALYNEEEGEVKLYLRGRPVILQAPSSVVPNYDIAQVQPPPQAKLKLDWVYGYRGRDCRSNLYLLPTGEMVYFVAAVVVLYNVEEQNQRHYLGHTDDIKCLGVHPNKLVVATGQAGGHEGRDSKPHIRVWNSVSLATLAVIGLGDFHRSISCLSFSKADSGALLCAVDEANEHNISVWDWQKSDKGHKITETKCSVDTVVAAEWHPLERNTIVTCGKNHISFWSLDQGGALYKRMGVFANREKPKYVTCLAFTQGGDVLSGDSNGSIIVWARGGNTVSRVLPHLHDGPIFSICVLKDGSIVSGGGKDGMIRQFDSDFQPSGYETQIAVHLGGVRTVAEGRGSGLLVGSTKNCILSGGLGLGFSPVVLGHTEELWALAPHPSLSQFVTAAWDSIIQLWDATARAVVWSKDIQEQAQSAAFSPDGSTIAVGCLNGKWLLMDAESREVYASYTDGNEPIQVISYSPGGEMVALGSRDNNIYVYQLSENSRKLNRVGRCTGHSSFITHLDWSSDGQYLRSNSGDYEVLYWTAGVCRQVTSPRTMRDVSWATHNCTLAFTSIGIWPEGADGTDVNAVTRSHDSTLLATADDFGKVKLYSYPASQPKSLCQAYGGHSSHVTAVAFLSDDSRLISTGGKDTAVLQWRIV